MDLQSRKYHDLGTSRLILRVSTFASFYFFFLFEIIIYNLDQKSIKVRLTAYTLYTYLSVSRIEIISKA